MRNFFISSLEMVINVVVVLMAVGVLIGGIAVMVAPGQMGGGFFAGLMVIVSGAVGVLITGGMMYLGLGIHANTRRTAELLEQKAGRA